MTNVLRIVILSALAVPAHAAAPSVQPGAAGRSDRSLTAVTRTGTTYLAARELNVDLAFPSGKTAKGKICVLYEPSTQLFLHSLDWDSHPSNNSCMESLTTQARVVLTADKLTIVWIGVDIVIVESSEKATSLNDAEAKSLQWHGARLPEIEARSIGPVSTGIVSRILLMRHDFPKDFLRPLDPRPVPPVRLLDIIQKSDTDWDLVIENSESHRRARVEIFRRKTVFQTKGPHTTWSTWWDSGAIRAE